MRWIVPVVLAARAAHADPVVVLSPVAMDGPYKTANAACVHAAPCGFHDITEKGEYIKPQKQAVCPAVGGGDRVDPNSVEPSPRGNGYNSAQLRHTSKTLELQIGSQQCAEPEGIRGERDIYYLLVKRSDGWWRSTPLWQWAYNEKYSAGSMLVRWNDQPGRTFVGVMAGIDEMECNKQSASHSTLELMVRVEPGVKTPVVFAPIVVGERFSQDALDPSSTPDASCKAAKHTDELTEKWTGDDDLELTGVATWNGFDKVNGAIDIRFGAPKPSSVGKYHFTR